MSARVRERSAEIEINTVVMRGENRVPWSHASILLKVIFVGVADSASLLESPLRPGHEATTSCVVEQRATRGFATALNETVRVEIV